MCERECLLAYVSAFVLASESVRVCVCLCLRVYARVCACVSAYVRICVFAYVCPRV